MYKFNENLLLKDHNFSLSISQKMLKTEIPFGIYVKSPETKAQFLKIALFFRLQSSFAIEVKLYSPTGLKLRESEISNSYKSDKIMLFRYSFT